MGGSILIVDDNPLNLKLARLVLEGAGHRVRTCSDAASALASALGDRPLLILADIQMPEIDGLALIEDIRGSEALGDVPVIAVTAQAMHGDRDRILAAGYDEYVCKPIDTRALPRIVAHHIVRGRVAS